MTHNTVHKKEVYTITQNKKVLNRNNWFLFEQKTRTNCDFFFSMANLYQMISNNDNFEQ